MFNKFRRKVLRVGQKDGEKTVDQDFEDGKTLHTELQQTIAHFSTGLDAYVGHTQALVQSVLQTTTEFDLIFQKSPNHDFAVVAAESKSAHDELSLQYTDAFVRLSSSRGLAAGAARFEESKKQCTSREEYRSKRDYYHAKLNEIQKNREKILAAGKQESEKELDRTKRNQWHFDEHNKGYERLNDTLKAEFKEQWTNRFENMGPILTEFLNTERTFVEILQRSVCALQDHTTLLPPNTSWEDLVDLETELKSVL